MTERLYLTFPTTYNSVLLLARHPVYKKEKKTLSKHEWHLYACKEIGLTAYRVLPPASNLISLRVHGS